MRHIHILFILFMAGQMHAQRKVEVKFVFENRIREAIISIPTTPPASDGYPIVLMAHGTSGDANVFYNANGWKELGQKENFVTIFPSSLEWCFYNKHFDRYSNTSRWVCGSLLDSLCVQEFPKLINDVAFLKKLIQLVSDSIKINKNKIFMAGFSNGSSMSHKISMDATDVFSASGGSSAGLHELDTVHQPKPRRIPMFYMLGTKDDRYFSDLFPTELPFGGDSTLIYIKGSITKALLCQGLADNFTRLETSISKVYTWTTCRPGEKCAPYVFMLNKGQTHQFPNGTNHPIDAPKILWEFYNNPPQVSLSTYTKVSPYSDQIKVYPNPATDYIIVSPVRDINFEIEVMGINGQTLIRKLNLSGENKVSLTGLARGTYLIKFISSEITLYKKILIV
jgi:poly(3-hydroxybutyrate) depolymerase